MINKVILIGNLGRDPEVRTLESGTKVAKFPIATNENYKDRSGEWQQRTEWHDIVAWTYLADKAERSLRKGSLVYVEGKLTHRKYTDKDGIDRYVTDVRAAVLKSLESRSSSPGGYDDSTFSSDDEQSGTDPFAGKLSDSGSGGDSADTEGSSDSSDDDLPF